MENIDWGMIASGLQTPMMDPLNDAQRRWPVAGMPPDTMGPNMSPIAPEALAQSMAARGIPPPVNDLGPTDPTAAPVRMPPPDAVQAWRNDSDMVMNSATGMPAASNAPSVEGPATTTTGGPSVGAPVSLAPPSTDASAQSREEKKEPTLADALRGVKMPASPVTQKLGTPAAPRPTGQIKGGEILALLQAMTAGGGGTGYQLPSTLGQALLGRK